MDSRDGSGRDHNRVRRTGGHSRQRGRGGGHREILVSHRYRQAGGLHFSRPDAGRRKPLVSPVRRPEKRADVPLQRERRATRRIHARGGGRGRAQRVSGESRRRGVGGVGIVPIPVMVDINAKAGGLFSVLVGATNMPKGVAYDIPASQATQTMNALIETTSLGDARLQDLAQALANVLPAAVGAGIGLDQVLGAMSTMTAEGENAASAGTHLRAALLNIEGGTATAAAAMEKYGITASQVRAELSGGGGLTGALTLMENAVAKGTTGFTEYMAKLQAAGSDQQKFDDLNSQVPANLAAPVGALESMTGGVRSFQSILELTGSHLQTFKDNVAKVGKSMHDAASEVQGFHTWANSTSGVVEQFKGAMSTLAVQVGNLLLPAFTAFMRVVA